MSEAVFIVDGGDVSAYSSVADAEASIEAYDVDSLKAYRPDGTKLAVSAAGYGCRLTPTNEVDLAELTALLRDYLSHPRIQMDPALADDPLRAAQAMLNAEWAVRPFRWLPWLDHRANGAGPRQI
ncbi:MAG: hypothetical protein QOI76_4304 [Frankiales bacterium]|nr:hypothetical protein [Frankiales bacterium]